MVSIEQLVRYGESYDGNWIRCEGISAFTKRGRGYIVYVLRDKQGHHISVLDFTGQQPRKQMGVEGVYISKMHLLIRWR